MNVSANNVFKWFTVLVFLTLLLPSVFQQGLFMDGLIYATLSHNLANDIGSFWFPSFSSTVMVDFFEHPPLVFGIQSLFFRIFGDAFYVEKLFSFLNAVFTAFLIIIIWRKIAHNEIVRRLYWLPVILWVLIPKVFWSYNNNLLENTMTVFSLSSIFFLFKTFDQRTIIRIFYIIIAALLIILSFLSKGFPGLFPLAFFFLYFLGNKKAYRTKNMLNDSFLLYLAFIIIFGGFLVLYNPAFESLSSYFGSQVMESLKGERVVGSRWFIMGVLFQEIIVIIIIVAVLNILYYGKSLLTVKVDKDLKRNAFLFIGIGLSASIPIMVSPKQLSFYIIPSLPYFVIGLSFVISSIVTNYLSRIRVKSSAFLFFKYINYCLIIIVIGFSAYSFGEYRRDQIMIKDVSTIGSFLENGKTITITKPLYQQWSLMAYFQRMYYISLDRSGKMHQYVLTTSDVQNLEDYDNTKLPLLDYKLWKKID